MRFLLVLVSALSVLFLFAVACGDDEKAAPVIPSICSRGLRVVFLLMPDDSG